MNEEEIKKEALKRYCFKIIENLPLKWIDNAIDMMLKEKQDEPTERLKELIDFVIKETKKSLSTFDKQKEHNSR